MGNLISIETRIRVKRIVPPEQLPTITAETKYHEDAETIFELAWDDHRYAMGVTWRCLRCGGEATISEEWVPETKRFLLRKLSCGQCGAWWLQPGRPRFLCDEVDEDDLYFWWTLLMRAAAHITMSQEV